MNEQEFQNKTGYAPIQDDLERVNCDRAGQLGHWYCGWCEKCDLPRFQCGHIKKEVKS